MNLDRVFADLIRPFRRVAGRPKRTGRKAPQTKRQRGETSVSIGEVTGHFQDTRDSISLHDLCRATHNYFK